jgi:mono/diheme cytochrome c family protein
MRRRILMLLLVALSCRAERPAPPGSVDLARTPEEATVAKPSDAPRAAADLQEPALPAAALAAALPIEPVDKDGSTSAGAVALARLGEHTLAFIADADDRALVTFDVETSTRLASTPLGARPSAVLVLPSGLVAVLGADDARMHLLHLAAIDAPLRPRRQIPLPDEPVSAARIPGTESLLVASRWGHALSIVSLEPEVEPVTIDLPRDPSAVMATPDGRRAVVMHAAGSRFSVVDLASRAVSTSSLDRPVVRETFGMLPVAPIAFDLEPDGISEHRLPKRHAPDTVTLRADQSFAMVRTGDGRLLAPEVFVDTGPPGASAGYGGGQAGTVTPAVVSFDESGKKLDPGGERTFGTHCLLPRGAAIDDAGKRLLVACLGADELVVLSVEARTFRLLQPIPVPKGPVAVAVDGPGRRAVVWSPLARAATVVGLEGDARRWTSTTLERSAPAPADEVLRGRLLFHATFDARVSSDGRACASCHPDGRDDGLTWSSPGGPMQTPVLMSRLEGTAPYGWDGAAEDLAHHLRHTTARLGGSGLSKRDVADVAAYLASLVPPRTVGRDARSRLGLSSSVRDARSRLGPLSSSVRDPDLVARGKDVFESEEAECSSCHAGVALTDGETHTLGGRGTARGARAFDTPSLRGVAQSSPYFHDGRYASLEDLLAGSDGSMGHTSQLQPPDRAALIAYLESL